MSAGILRGTDNGEKSTTEDTTIKRKGGQGTNATIQATETMTSTISFNDLFYLVVK